MLLEVVERTGGQHHLLGNLASFGFRSPPILEAVLSRPFVLGAFVEPRPFGNARRCVATILEEREQFLALILNEPGFHSELAEGPPVGRGIAGEGEEQVVGDDSTGWQIVRACALIAPSPECGERWQRTCRS
jgi:hypothetical protein